MIENLRIENFKAWSNTKTIRIAPLTIFCGNNSSGKSSISQFLLMLKQTTESYDRQRVLHLGDSSSLVDLGSYVDLIHKHEDSKKLSFAFTFGSAPIKIVDASKALDKSYSKINFSAEIGFDKDINKISLDSFEYQLLNGDVQQFALKLKQGKYSLESSTYNLIRQQGRVWKLPSPENFFGFPNEAIAYYQNTAFLKDLSLAMQNFFRSFYYVGPLRNYPERFYQFSGEVPPHVGENGTLAVNAMLAAKGRLISKGYKQRTEKFEELIARWLRDMGLIYSFHIDPIGKGRNEYEVKIKTSSNSAEVLITDVGFGVSQVLPVVVQCFYVSPESILLFEQPEIHLHPSVQSHLGDLFIETIKSRENGKDRNIQLIIESHSEHLIRRIQRRIAEEIITPSDVAIYFISQKDGEATITELKIDLFGNITNWPDNFFGDEVKDLAEMTRAARERKLQ